MTYLIYKVNLPNFIIFSIQKKYSLLFKHENIIKI